MGEREVAARPDLETVRSALTDINDDLSQVEAEVSPKATDIAKL